MCQQVEAVVNTNVYDVHFGDHGCSLGVVGCCSRTAPPSGVGKAKEGRKEMSSAD